MPPGTASSRIAATESNELTGRSTRFNRATPLAWRGVGRMGRIPGDERTLKRVDLLCSWVRENPVGKDPVSYETSYGNPMTPIIEVRNAVADALETALPAITFEKRFVGYLKRADVTIGKWLVTPAGDERKTAARDVVLSTAVVDVIWEIALPESTDTYPDPLGNTTWFDTQMQAVETVKDLFATDGQLRYSSFAGFGFVRLSNNPIYRPDLLTDYQIFTSIVRLELLGEV